MVEASDDQGDTKDAKGKEPEGDGDNAIEDEATVDESDVEEDDDDDEEEEEEGEDEEPKLKYARLTAHLLSVYRNGDMTSAFLVAGDKMVSRGREVCLRASAEPCIVRWHPLWQPRKYSPITHSEEHSLINHKARHIPPFLQVSTSLPPPRQCIHFLHLDFPLPSASPYCSPRRC
jgi:hypothetical protein